MKKNGEQIKRIGCLHAHHSNIEYIESALSSFMIEMVHFVDPGLMYQLVTENKLEAVAARKKVGEQLEWIAQCNVDAILISCTNYIAIMQEEIYPISIPIIKIDEPFFENICRIRLPHKILFTNPATVAGTMERLEQYASSRQLSLDIEVEVIENSFELIVKGQKEKYTHEVYKYLKQVVKDDNRVVSVAQLSMVEAAKRLENEICETIINPLDTLVSQILDRLE